MILRTIAKKGRHFLLPLLCVGLAASSSLTGFSTAANANPLCCGDKTTCSSECALISSQQTQGTIAYLRSKFVENRGWMVQQMSENHMLPALMLMTEQLTAMAMHQVVTVGMFLDAKHQLETQRLFQELTAQAHKDYHPSEGMCMFGTTVRSLAASDRNNDLSALAISNRMLKRELLSGDAITGNGRSSDFLSRAAQFRNVYCNKADNGKGLDLLCPSASKQPGRENNDINFTNTFDGPLTLKMDFTDKGNTDHAANMNNSGVSADEEDVFALAANLYAHNVAPSIPPALLSSEAGEMNAKGVYHYMNIRALTAKRSVASSSFAAIAAMKSQGGEEVQPYLYAIMKEMGLDPEDENGEEIKKYLGERPSYYAQMEVLTKKLYQNPAFYTELYDKPANVERKTVSMQAIELMQRRDMYRSILRSESILSVMLETALADQQDKVLNEIGSLNENGELIELP